MKNSGENCYKYMDPGWDNAIWWLAQIQLTLSTHNYYLWFGLNMNQDLIPCRIFPLIWY